MTAFKKTRFENAQTIAVFDDLFDAAAQELAGRVPEDASLEDGVEAWLQNVGLGDLRYKIEVRENDCV